MMATLRHGYLGMMLAGWAYPCMPVACWAAPPAIVYQDAIPLPEVKVAGQVGKIHTQGLLVTKSHYWVTGRWEGVPKRPLLIRFDRQDVGNYEVLDLGPAVRNIRGTKDDAVGELDHPGGFDLAHRGDLFIPVSTSHRRGPTVVLRVVMHAGPAPQWPASVAFRVEDHIGALAWDAASSTLLGANWDTQDVYRWTHDGKLREKHDRSSFLATEPDWALAIQDWKGLSGGRLIAGGIDKSKTGAVAASSAVLQFLDLRRGGVASTHRLPAVIGVTRPVTNEGMCLRGDTLYLLPEDIGKGAKVLRYLVRKP